MEFESDRTLYPVIWRARYSMILTICGGSSESRLKPFRRVAKRLIGMRRLKSIPAKKKENEQAGLFGSIFCISNDCRL